MRKKITLKDIAEPLNLSTASVSMILNRKNISRFSKETVDAVLQTAKEIGYVTKEKSKREIIHLICPSVTNPYYTNILQNIQYSANNAGYFTVIHTTYWNEQQEIDILHRIDKETAAGIIFSMPPQSPNDTLEISKHIPLVVIGDRNSDLQLDTVDVNNYTAAQILGEHLVSLGHKHIAYVSTTLNEFHSARVLRLEGLQHTFNHGTFDGDMVVYSTDVPSDVEMENLHIEYAVGHQLALECIAKTPEVTAIVAINDMVAFGVIDAIQELGYAVPRDYSVCGFDNILSSSFHDVGLTTMDHAIAERGKRAFRLLLKKIHAGKKFDAQAPITRLEYKSELIVRKTTDVPRNT